MSPSKEQIPGIPNPEKDPRSLQNQIDELSRRLDDFIRLHEHNGVDATRVNLDDLMGLFETVDVVPTAIPKSIYDQVKMYDAGDYQILFWYDVTAQAWRPMNVGSISFVGKVNNDGTEDNPFPTGWSSAKNATGDYTVTHNLGDNNYVVVFSTDDDDSVACLDLRQSNSFNVTITDLAGVAADQDFYFILMLVPS